MPYDGSLVISDLTRLTKSYVAGQYIYDFESRQVTLVCAYCRVRLHCQFFDTSVFTGEPPVCKPCVNTSLREMGFVAEGSRIFIDHSATEELLHCRKCNQDAKPEYFGYDLKTGAPTCTCTTCSALTDLEMPRENVAPERLATNTDHNTGELPAAQPSNKHGNGVDRQKYYCSRDNVWKYYCSRHKGWKNSQLFSAGYSICDACVQHYHGKKAVWMAQGLCLRGGCPKEDATKSHCEKHSAQMKQWGINKMRKRQG